MLALQRQHGNRYVQRVVAIDRNGKGDADVSGDVEQVLQRVRGGGQPLDSTVRNQMESAFGANLSRVRIHTDGEADELNQTLQARAFTTGQDIFFRRGEYDPGSSSGRELLAHELTHVMQQSGEEIQQKLTVGQPGDRYEQEADRVAKAVIQQEQEVSPQESDELGIRRQEEEEELQMQPLEEEEEEELQMQPLEEEEEEVVRGKMKHDRGHGYLRGKGFPISRIIRSTKNDLAGRLIQRVPAPGSNFGTRRGGGFRITTKIPGFIKEYFTGSFDVDYKMGSYGIDAWASVWELYDSADKKLDSNEEIPHGDYAIESEKVDKGTPGDGRAKWSLWYRITRSQPWLTDNDDAYPYDFVTFDVYSSPIKNPKTKVKEETGPVIWQDNYTPAEDGASVEYNFSTTAKRTETESQTTTVSVTVGGEKSTSLGFEFEGLTGGFANKLSYSATQSMSRTHSLSVETSKTESKKYSQTNLKAGNTYKVIARPLFHLIEGSVDLISHRDGVITKGGQTITGGIRLLRGLDIKTE
ncbi:MAG: DUF4157 domain-containing protein, partial [Deltaproteobacteria bacterium]